MVKKILVALLVIILIYLAGLGALFFMQRKILYRPDQTYLAPAQAYAYLRMSEFPVTTSDNLALKGWYAPAGDRPLTIVYFHGNADTLLSTAPIAAPYLAAGYGFLLAEYRGYSGLPGSPSEDGLYSDARAYLNALIKSGVNPHSIILMGYSLGSGVATQMATEFDVGGMILLAPFTSVGQAAQFHYPFYPVEKLVQDKYENFKKIPSLHMPLLIVNGGSDKIIPPQEGRDLYEMANEPKQFYFVPQGTHVDLFQSDLYSVSLTWLHDLAPASATKP